MSVQAMSWVFDEVRGLSPVQRLVLLSIANHADKYGNNAWPSVATIREEADVSRENTVRDALRALRENGWIEVEVNQGGDGRVPANRRPNRYSLPRMRGGAFGVYPEGSGGAVEVVRGGASPSSGGAVGGYQTVLEPSTKTRRFADEDPPQVAAARARQQTGTASIEAIDRDFHGVTEVGLGALADIKARLKGGRTVEDVA